MIEKIVLRKREEDRITAGHPWVYDNEIFTKEIKSEAGGVVDVFSSKNRFLGRGFYNPHSKIRVRILSKNQEEINREFLQQRILSAAAYRKAIGVFDFCRLVYAEADLLPGLIIDKFDTYFSIQTLSFGMDKRLDDIVSVLRENFDVAGIYERNDATVRKLEGLEEKSGFIGNPFETKIKVKENGLEFYADFAEGQKTGYYFDQRENHAAIAPFVKNKNVLDAFSYTGGFGLHALKYGASGVISVDISENAIAELGRNAELNGLTDGLTTKCENVFDYLKNEVNENKRFDTIILDPPPFCKSRSALKQAYKGYKEINLRALQMLGPGGYLVTCSCSFHMTPELFLHMLKDAAADTGKTLRIAEQRIQAKDHPVLLGFEESLYLKCIIARVI